MAPRSAPGARKSLGQHFLKDEDILHRIAASVRGPEGGVVVEIGPGPGALTRPLLASGAEVVALEVDRRMILHLHRELEGPMFRLVEQDARDADYADLLQGRPFAAVGNLPYFAAAPIIRNLLESSAPASDIVVMVQREVAKEMAAAPGKLSIFGISVQVYAEPEILFDVPATAFDPSPKVVSTVIRLTPHPVPLVPPDENEAFFTLVKRTFKHGRKQLHNALARTLLVEEDAAPATLERAGIEGTRRPETLSIAEWLDLLRSIETPADG